MIRETQSELIRTMIRAQKRSPVEAAVSALACLSSDDLDAAIARFNRIFADPERRTGTTHLQVTRK
jgi:hypothetical protein